MDTGWISQTMADTMAAHGHAVWMLTDPAGCAKSIDIARDHFRSGRFDWLLSVLHQSPHSKSRRGTDSAADQYSYAVLTLLIQRRQLFMKTFPVSAWARPDADYMGNGDLLASIEALQSHVSEPSTYGHDGFVSLTEDIEFQELGLNTEDYRGDNVMPVKAGLTFPLEIGSIALSKSIAILTTGGTLARLPYEVPGGEPMVFAFALRQ